MVTLLYTLIVLACIIVVVAVLLQPAKDGGLSALGGSSQSVFGSTGGTTFLFRITLGAAAFVMLASLYLSRHVINANKSSRIPEAAAGLGLGGDAEPSTNAGDSKIAIPTAPPEDSSESTDQ